MLVGVAIVFCLPFYLLVAIALETTPQSYKTPMSFPLPPHFGNFSTAWGTNGQGGLGHPLESSLIITVSSVAGLIVFGSLGAYAIARRRGKLSDGLYVAFVVGIILPFQLAIIPLFVAMERLGLTGTYIGMITLNIGLLMPLSVFLYTGFIRALPRDYEEAAWVDGAGIFRTYARIVFPLLLPITATVAVARRRDRLERVLPGPALPERQPLRDDPGRPLRLRRRLRGQIQPDLRRDRDRSRSRAPLLPLRAAAHDPQLHGGDQRLMAAVTLSGVGKVYPDGTRAVSALDLEIADGELMVLVGPSGCGKTTTLRMTAGLEEITEGEIRIGDRVVNTLDPRQRDIAMVFQNYALYPHMTVFDNMAFPLQARRLPREEIRARVDKTAKLLGLEGQLKRKPRTLSGGQRQRVAMGRAIIREPQVFLMDEPLSNLDAKLRTQMRAEIAGLQRELGVTTMYVTHDQVEAMTMGTANRRHARRPSPTAGRAAAALRRARQPVRRGLHRLAGDEPPPGPNRAGWRRARVRSSEAPAAA